MTSKISIEQLKKNYNDTTAVNGIDINVSKGEFFSLVGPSGCGKTTTLRMIAGLTDPTSGKIKINGDEITNLPPNKRDIGIVFQDYALFPHKTVEENLGFGLKMQDVGKKERQEQVNKFLQLVGLEGFGDRNPQELSGGQQQRIALARALITKPKLLLLDEPLSNLDLKLKKDMRFELKKIQTELGVTTIYVTHDQDEALSMSDRVGIMKDGEIAQVGKPTEIYKSPRNTFVADFLGESNILTGSIESINGDRNKFILNGKNGKTSFNVNNLNGADINGEEVNISFRPENIIIYKSNSEFSNDTDDFVEIDGEIITKTFSGQFTTFLIDVQGHEIRASLTGSEHFTKYQEGENIKTGIKHDDIRVLEEA